MRRVWVAVFLCVLATAVSRLCLAQDARSVTLTILCDNDVHDAGFQAEWGFSCLVRGLEKTILFDVGGPQYSIRANLRIAGIDLASIDAIAFSHAHGDHVDGLQSLLPLPPTISLYVPAWFPSAWKRAAEAQASTIPVTGPTEICADAVLTGPVFGAYTEEALCVHTPSGIVVITGCAHPGIVKIVEATKALFPGETIVLVLGGFHLGQESEAAIRAIAQRLLELGVVRIAPTHCSGDLARAVFRDVFGLNYIEAGVGLVLEL
jgi:7,8-dihydropterin-6-yl-methyl-4-(beta-D-ribofuranosyl)aminobenzene 5'-phosphate synthase